MHPMPAPNTNCCLLHPLILSSAESPVIFQEPLARPVAQHPSPSTPRKGTESSRAAVGTERGSTTRESLGLELPKAYVPQKHREMLPAWITPNSLLEKHIQPLGCHQPTGGIPLVTSCAQPDAQGHPPAQRPWHGHRTNSFVTERRQGQATHISWRGHSAGWGRSCHGQN